MKFAPVSLALAAVLAAGSLSVPTFAVAQDYRTYNDYCHSQKKKGQHGGALIGAIAGAVIGSNMASHHGGRTGGALLGAAAGAAVGSNVGRDAAKAKCDDQGAYWDQGDTYDYRDRTYYRGGGAYRDDYYEHNRCRWAREYDGDYVRVCPDRHGHYHVTR